MKITLDKIIVKNEVSPRFVLDESYIEELKSQIENLPPILITKDFVLIDGFHRLEAVKQVKKREIEVKIYENGEDVYALAAKLNMVHGKRLSIEELARRIIFLIKERGWTQEEAAKYFNKSRTWIGDHIRGYNSVNKDVSRGIKDYTLLRELSRVPIENQLEVLERAKEIYNQGTFREKKERTSNFSRRSIIKAVREKRRELDAKKILENDHAISFSPSLKLYNKSSEVMNEIADNSIHMIISSPPYNNNTAYNGYNDNISHEDYVRLLNNILQESSKKLVDGGRVAWILPAVVSKKKFSIAFIPRLFENNALSLRETIVWKKSENNIPEGTAWGSWCSPKNPYLRSVIEFIFIAHKNTPYLEGETGDMTPDEFMSWTTDIWKIMPFSNPSHPAVFPEELVERLIKLYTFPNMTILDPFCGIGTVGIVCKRLKRNFVGYDISRLYIDLARSQLCK